jgi:uncharacterized iron-regulated protein
VAATLAAATLAAQVGYVPHRVLHTGTRAIVDFEGMLNDLAGADVVFVGEQHDDPNTHRLELAILEGLARRRDDVIVSLEMFERDVQEPLDHFLMGHTAEDEFLAEARPWPRYATDYKPLVDFAVSREWPVIASNVPRPMASEVSTSGLDALEDRSEEERRWFAADLQCPTNDDYFERFTEAMARHPAEGDGEPAVAARREMTERFYLAQCLKDETMGESIARAWTAGRAVSPRPLVVHVNGAFHTDFGLGTAARVRRRLPAQRLVVVSILPVEDLTAVAPTDEDLRRAEYLLYTLKK